MNRRRGIALVMALLLVAIGTITIAALIDSSQLALARTRNQLREQQAYAYARGLEAWAIELLRRDRSEDPSRDSRQDLWAQGLPPMDIPGGKLAGRMRDLNGCFNLNALLKNGIEDAVARRRFERLLGALQLDTSLSESVLDWIDADSTPHSRGAETLNYLLLDPPYRAANQAMVQVSELRLVRGIDARVYAALEPHVCALPTPSDININTASIPVLMALADGLSESEARRIYNEGRANFTNVDAFQAQLQQFGRSADGGLDGIQVTSNWFLAETMLELDGIPLNYFSLIERGPDRSRVRQRSRGSY
ncbi:MAG: type II secretion system minor pseudopilin GspK [Lysobacterales bacterium]